jgi:deoxyguanosine kinase
MTIIISIEGNIGSGKSSVIKELKKKYKQFYYLEEPVDSWTSVKDDNGKTILDLFYGDNTRWAYTFQNLAYITRVKQILAIKDKYEYIVMERSIFTDRNVFAKIMEQDGHINKIEKGLYDQWFEFLNKDVKVDGYIYIKADPKTSLERIRKRNRQGEENITLEYLEKLHKAHNEWLIQENTTNIDGNDEMSHNYIHNIYSQIGWIIKEARGEVYRDK